MMVTTWQVTRRERFRSHVLAPLEHKCVILSHIKSVLLLGFWVPTVTPRYTFDADWKRERERKHIWRWYADVEVKVWGHILIWRLNPGTCFFVSGDSYSHMRERLVIRSVAGTSVTHKHTRTHMSWTVKHLDTSTLKRICKNARTWRHTHTSCRLKHLG